MKHAKQYGGNVWARIGRKVRKLDDALMAGDADVAALIERKLQGEHHNTSTVQSNKARKITFCKPMKKTPNHALDRTPRSIAASVTFAAGSGQGNRYAALKEILNCLNEVTEMARTPLLGIPVILFTVFAAFPVVVAAAEDVHYARGVVIQALEPNKLGVGGREFKTKPNPKGEGVFVYDPRTRFSGVERNLIWIVLDDAAYPLNGPSKMITPSLNWPRDVDVQLWKKTGLSPYMATDAIEIVFGKK